MQEPNMDSRTKRRRFDAGRIHEIRWAKKNATEIARKRVLQPEAKNKLRPRKRTKRRCHESTSIDDVIYTDREGRYMMMSVANAKDTKDFRCPERKIVDIQSHNITVTPPQSPCPEDDRNIQVQVPFEKELEETSIICHEAIHMGTTNASSTVPGSVASRVTFKSETTLITKKETAKPDISSSRILMRWWKFLLVAIGFCSVIYSQYTKQPFHKECVYVNGGGFSGFWFMLGQLYKLQEQKQAENYLCYSAGCLGVVSVLANRSFEELFDSALSIQNNWKDGEISRFDALETFVDDLLDHNATLEVDLFSNVHIITSVATRFGWEVHMNTPVDIEHLRTLLIQTAWIPFVTGNDIWHSTGHVDGGFSRLQHPTCSLHISLPWDLTLLANAVNINMRKEEGERYWNLGMAS